MSQANLNYGNGATVSSWLRREYIVTYADVLKLGTGLLTGDLLLDIFPAGTMLHGATVEVTTLFAGTGITDFDVILRWGATGSEADYGSSLDVDTALGRTNATTTTAGSFTTTNSLLLRVTSVGANTSLTSAGVVKIVVNIGNPMAVDA
jgi:hypothetical protein